MRYTGHDTKANKAALCDVLSYRSKVLGKELSVPEATALLNSEKEGKPVTGEGNRTAEMPTGTAICHKVSDFSIRSTIEDLSPHPEKLEPYLRDLIEYIRPRHESDETPEGSYYHAEVQKKYKAAVDAFRSYREPTLNPEKKLKAAHQIGKAVATSPVNLFIGDRSINSSVSARNDINAYRNRASTPRSTRGRVFSYEHHTKQFQYTGKQSSILRSESPLRLRNGETRTSSGSVRIVGASVKSRKRSSSLISEANSPSLKYQKSKFI